MNAKLFPFFLLLISALAIGCTSRIVNLTPERVPQNPSGIYTLSMSTDFGHEPIVDGSLQPSIIIDGQKYRMRPSPVGEGIWDYDYQLPEGRDSAAFYYVITYQSIVRDSITPQSEQSDLYRVELVNRYVITLESERGPVGSRIPVVGRGFSEPDTIYIGGIEANTSYGNSNSLSFIVPPLEAGRRYEVELDGSAGRMPIGVFQVDPTKLRVTPSAVRAQVGERSLLVIGIESEAPAGGLVIDALTDIPDALVMPEIVIPRGSRTVSIPLEGIEPARGTLYLSAPGFDELSIPITIN